MQPESLIYVYGCSCGPIHHKDDEQEIVMVWYDHGWQYLAYKNRGVIRGDDGPSPAQWLAYNWQPIERTCPLITLHCAECGKPSFRDYLCKECRTRCLP